MTTKEDFADMRATIEALREARETIERLEAENKMLWKVAGDMSDLFSNWNETGNLSGDLVLDVCSEARLLVRNRKHTSA